MLVFRVICNRENVEYMSQCCISASTLFAFPNGAGWCFVKGICLQHRGQRQFCALTLSCVRACHLNGQNMCFIMFVRVHVASTSARYINTAYMYANDDANGKSVSEINISAELLSLPRYVTLHFSRAANDPWTAAASATMLSNMSHKVALAPFDNSLQHPWRFHLLDGETQVEFSMPVSF